MPATDRELVAYLIGREPMGDFSVVVRRDDGSPVVIENSPFLDDGRPMPTRFWLVDRALSREIGRLESSGGVDRAEAEVGHEVIRQIHDRYREGREALMSDDREGPAPSGGVGGTRIGVKCLHAHYANFLVGADDAVGQWVDDHLKLVAASYDPSSPGIASRWEERTS